MEMAGATGLETETRGNAGDLRGRKAGFLGYRFPSTPPNYPELVPELVPEENADRRVPRRRSALFL